MENMVRSTLSGQVEAAEALFEISDRGIGIPVEDQRRLFEAFHRGKNVGEIASTGLRLVIVKRCVDLHDGTIVLTSEVGRGTTCTVRFQLFKDSAQPRKVHKTLAKKRK
jgi:signal transduction histidine kinase